MPFKDILLYIDSYPEPVTPEAIDQAVRFAGAVGGDLSALAVQVDLRAPSSWLADHMIGLSGMCAEQEKKSLGYCEDRVRHFSEALAKQKRKGQAQIIKADMYRVGEHLAYHARTRDLCLVPIMERLGDERSVAESVIFGSGRPVVVYRPGAANLMGRGLSTIVIAWDGSRAAARAMADALPLLPKARVVRLVTILNDKPDARVGMNEDALRHLKAHGVEALADEIPSDGRKAGEAIAEYAIRHKSDLLVMGAYGRSRLREFVLGGATEYMLSDLRVPLFLSR
ncbi:universal stress protein [Phenylobacterium sp. J367]|uniref:universal stress protein n=1 Tax=Phenylobacterium sp. J367 TaxID=2898435 RepID=UPI0021511A0B|nr:universal stress protein [Phenylobacterium sp. J367]MCR5881292.1 universal stress protein [Phenylobacterium sp. J367]